MLARSLRTLLAVALLLAWSNALVHPIAHVDAAGGFVHLADGKKNDNAPDPLCDAVAAVAACIAGSSGFDFAVPKALEAGPAWQAQEFHSAPRPAYLSQAPPQFS